MRNVPDEVADRLEELAARANVSLNTLVLWELQAAAQRAANAELLAALPHLGIDTADLAGDASGDSG